MANQVWGGAIVAGQDHQGRASFGGHRLHYLKAVGPVGPPPQQANDDQLSVAQNIIGVGVDRQLLLELEQTGHPQSRKLSGEIRAGQTLNFGIGGGQKHQRSRGLLYKNHALGVRCPAARGSR